MTQTPLARHARRLVALALMTTAYAFARLPAPAAGARMEAIRQFRFVGEPIAEPPAGEAVSYTHLTLPTILRV